MDEPQKQPVRVILPFKEGDEPRMHKPARVIIGDTEIHGIIAANLETDGSFSSLTVRFIPVGGLTVEHVE